jgi:hypothetical protein
MMSIQEIMGPQPLGVTIKKEDPEDTVPERQELGKHVDVDNEQEDCLLERFLKEPAFDLGGDMFVPPPAAQLATPFKFIPPPIFPPAPFNVTGAPLSSDPRIFTPPLLIPPAPPITFFTFSPAPDAPTTTPRLPEGQGENTIDETKEMASRHRRKAKRPRRLPAASKKYEPHEALGVGLDSSGQLMIRMARKGSAGVEFAPLTQASAEVIATAVSRQFKGTIPRILKRKP